MRTRLWMRGHTLWSVSHCPKNATWRTVLKSWPNWVRWQGVFFDLNPDGLLYFNAFFVLYEMFYLTVQWLFWHLVCVANKGAWEYSIFYFRPDAQPTATTAPVISVLKNSYVKWQISVVIVGVVTLLGLKPWMKFWCYYIELPRWRWANQLPISCQQSVLHNSSLTPSGCCT